MKKLPEIVIFCCIAFGLLTSGTMEKRSVNNPDPESLPGAEHDTTGFISLLKIDPFNLTIIPPSCGVSFFKNSNIVFLSNTKEEGKMPSAHVSFGSIEAYSALVKDTTVGKHKLFSPSSSFSFPCEAISFSPDYKIMYYTKIPKKEKREKIYRAELGSNDQHESGWVTDDKPINFCTGDFTYTHPAISADGQLMIFASDKGGTSGGMDLFLSRKNGDTWSSPESLGKTINTMGNEFFPFLDSNDNLFFSSDGIHGYGGYDVYTCKFNGESWDKPVNLSGKINSENDEIAFSIDRSDGKSAFYTSRKNSGRGMMQLFKVTLLKDLVDNKPVTISYVYNGAPVTKEDLVAQKAEEKPKPPEKEVAKSAPVVTKKEEEKKPEVKVAEKKPPEPQPAVKAPEAKVVTIKPTITTPEEFRDVVIYRVQFLSGTKRNDDHIIINGISYKTYEYFYLELYRYTIGEFTTLPPAVELQAICRKAGYAGAFVAAFKNNTRSLDLKLFR